jgi:broad specificity phosphatase PhoE
MIRDPGLTEHGLLAARAYGPVLKDRLAAVGVSVEGAVVGASELRRAQETAAALFRREPVVFPFFTEYGDIPENTPAGKPYTKPNLKRMLADVRQRFGESQPVIVVGHGSFLRSAVFPALTGQEWRGSIHNLDAFVVELDAAGSGSGTGKLVRVIRYSGKPMDSVKEDRCRVKNAAFFRMPKHSRKNRSQKNRAHKHQQRGGGTMPLAWYHQGAQMQGRYLEPTGVGLAQPLGNVWSRAPLNQTGGRQSAKRQTGCRRRQGKEHVGGFSPAIMGPFAESGIRLLPPVVAYIGHRFVKNSRRKTRRRKTAA